MPIVKLVGFVPVVDCSVVENQGMAFRVPL